MHDEKIYSQLKKELPAIAKIVSSFPESLHGRVFEALVGQLLGDASHDPAAPAKGAHTKVHDKEIKGIAYLDEQERFHLSVRDPKAQSTNEAALRLTYVVIRAYEQLTGNAKASSKEVVNPVLDQWRCYTGNTRNVLAKDKGIHREGGLVWLDTPAKEEADKLIKEILDDKIKGAWKPSASSGKSRKKEANSGKSNA
jgi:hypothetical protein